MIEPVLGHCKLCELEDFSDPELLKLMRNVFSSKREQFGDRFPEGREERKLWEIAMTLRAFRAAGALRDDAQVLGVGAGHEATIYWLTNQVGRVVATDLYEAEDAWSETDSGAEMLTDPGKYWDGPWNSERLVVRHMNALELEFEDESFDAVFSSSSIEHFGEFSDVRRAVEEIHRVLRPGGIAALSTEFRLEGSGAGLPGVLMFDEPELRSLVLDGLWWDPIDPIDTSISEQTLAGEVSFPEVIADFTAGRKDFRVYPHIVLRDGSYLWTSVHLALVKSRLGSAEWRRRSPQLPPRTSLPAKLVRRARARLSRARVRLGRRLGRGPGR
jgi:SAM-dependent methyltransferase